jgi:hypothetical protein
VTDELPMLRNSERFAFKRCQAQWNWAWNYQPGGIGLTPIFEPQGARWFGSMLHIALAEWYTPPKGKNGFCRGRDPRETWEELAKEAHTKLRTTDFNEEVEQEWADARDLGAIMLAGYLAHHGIDESWEVLMPEQRFDAKIPYNNRQKRMLEKSDSRMNPSTRVRWATGGRFITRLVGTFDMPIRDHSVTGSPIKIVDHKSTGKRESIAHLTKDDQIGTYISVSTGFLRNAKLIESNEAVTGVTFNYLRKSKPKDDRQTNEKGQFLNKDGSVSKNQGVPLFWREEVLRNKSNRIRQVVRIADDAEAIAAVRSGALPILKNPGEHCAWCDFKDLCDVDEDGGDVEQYIKDAFKTQDMYADHRIGAINSKESVEAKKTSGVR